MVFEKGEAVETSCFTTRIDGTCTGISSTTLHVFCAPEEIHLS